MQQFIKKEVDTKLRNASDVVIFADEAISVAKKRENDRDLSKQFY